MRGFKFEIIPINAHFNSGNGTDLVKKIQSDKIMSHDIVYNVLIKATIYLFGTYINIEAASLAYEDDALWNLPVFVYR
jgi:hypothetical protein